jgi:hypothetical protein
LAPAQVAVRRPKPAAVLRLSAAPRSRVQVVSWLFPAPVPAASKPAAAAPVVAPYRQAQRHSACAQNLRRRGPDSGRRLPDRHARRCRLCAAFGASRAERVGSSAAAQARIGVHARRDGLSCYLRHGWWCGRLVATCGCTRWRRGRIQAIHRTRWVRRRSRGSLWIGVGHDRGWRHGCFRGTGFTRRRRRGCLTQEVPAETRGNEDQHHDDRQRTAPPACNGERRAQPRRFAELALRFGFLQRFQNQ